MTTVMDSSSLDLKQIEAFFAACAPMMGAYRHSSFSYVAIKQEGGLALIQGRLRLAILPPEMRTTGFSTKCVFAEHRLLTDLGCDARALLDRVLSGSLETTHGQLRLHADGSGRHNAHFTPFHDEGLRAQNRLNVLDVHGARPDPMIRQPDLDWELKAAETPYDSLADLLLDFGLGPYRSDATRIEVIGETVAVIDFSSTVADGRARIIVRATEGLDYALIALGYRLMDGNRVVRRARISGKDMKWESREGMMLGEAELDVASGGVMHCIASYAGIAQHHYWLADPARLPNTQRISYEAFDNQMTLIKEVFDSAEGRSYQARDMEAAVAWMLWLHGFLVAHLGGTQKIQVPGPDIIAMTPHSGNIAVIECTTKHLGSDKKLPDLVANAERLRRRLDAAGQGHRSILKILVTTLRSEDIAAKRDAAERLGVLVLTRENIDNAITRTIAVPNPEQMYAEAQDVVRAALAKHVEQPSLPGMDLLNVQT